MERRTFLSLAAATPFLPKFPSSEPVVRVVRSFADRTFEVPEGHTAVWIWQSAFNQARAKRVYVPLSRWNASSSTDGVYDDPSLPTTEADVRERIECVRGLSTQPIEKWFMLVSPDGALDDLRGLVAFIPNEHLTIGFKPSRAVFDIRNESERLAFIAYVNTRTECPFSEDFLLGLYEQYEGEPTRLSTYGVDILVPRSHAELVWGYRRQSGIPLVA